MDGDFIVVVFVVVGYAFFSYIAASYLKMFDGIRRFVIAILLGWAIIPIGFFIFVFRTIGRFFKWLFRL